MLTTYKLNLNKLINLDDDKFYELCRDNPDLRLEKNATGEIIIMSPTGSETSRKNAKIVILFGFWNESKQLGEIFDSNGGFTFPNGAIRSPDVSWIEKSRWNRLSKSQQDKFAPIVPDFVLELKSKSDILAEVQAKMVEYISQGVRLGWLINPDNKTVEIYRPGADKQVLENPDKLSGDEVLPEFELNLSKVWG